MRNFLTDMENTSFSLESANPNKNYLFLTNWISKIVEKHVFFSNKLRKAIYTGSRFRSNSIKSPDKLNRKLYKQQRIKCLFVWRKSIKQYFSNIVSNGKLTTKNFWKASKPFLAEKGCRGNKWHHLNRHRENDQWWE